MRKTQRLVDEFAYPGFTPLTKISDHPTKQDSRIITMRRRQKKRYVGVAEQSTIPGMTGRNDLSEIYHVETRMCILRLRYDVFHVKYAEK